LKVPGHDPLFPDFSAAIGHLLGIGDQELKHPCQSLYSKKEEIFQFLRKAPPS